MEKPSMYDKLKGIVKGLENKTEDSAQTAVDSLGAVTKTYTDKTYNTALTGHVHTGAAMGNITSISGVTSVPGTGYTYTTGIVTAANPPYYGITGGANFGGYAMPSPTADFNLSVGGKDIVRITNEGHVIWNNDNIDIDAAAEAFKRSISMGVELKAGITEKTKRDMRDSIFEDIISIAKDKGSITAEDLTYLLQAAKIMDKLKGGK
jgi:formyltetrahydrofolate synthetase